ncbi:GNAT family N-acetyltransferase [Streptomyces sp. HNM0663]|uniref:GNAT family N-acetyltransferase n=1 Tax=Streptomyces chengmaiensis TaxID=3040919 RepID=A0ABT6HRX6_9ACTN|nr:GNAT family N-acetyltransferase [Streptomyces chengmaiensis]MDH2391477.1 GNAT family N-acetyltransferase [Streptomyces chengmaiensis]
MTVIVRDFRPEDATAVCRIRRAAVPFLVTTPRSVLHSVEGAHPDRRQRLLVAELNGEIIAQAYAGLAHDAPELGQAYVNPQTHPDHLGSGAGGLLLRTAEEHLTAEGAREVFAWVTDEPRSLAFAEKRGYRPSRSSFFQRLDLVHTPLPELPERLPPGVELRTAAGFAADPRPLFRADAEVTADEPGDIGVALSDYEAWLADVWHNPLLDRELTTVVLVDGEVAAFTAAHTDGGTRYATGMTGTLRAHRGRGFAKLAKTHSLRRARDAGYTDAFTGNDTGNAPMLAVNKWFGYQICASEVRHVRTLG